MYKENFHKRIKLARINAGYTQRQVSEIVGLHQSKIAKIETGNQELGFESLGMLAVLYCVSIDWLFGLGSRNQKRCLVGEKHR